MKNHAFTKITVLLFAVLLAFTSCRSGNANAPKETDENISFETTLPVETVPVETEEIEPIIEVDLDAIGVDSRCVFLMNETKNRVMVNKNSSERVPVASLTKLMTALVAIEKNDNPSLEYSFEVSVIDSLVNQNASRAGFEAGESVKMLDLLYAAMLPSGADGAYGLAMLTAGSIDGFVAMMNEKAVSLGMNDTHFADPVGLDDSGYSTAEDICVLMEAVLANSSLRDIISSSEWVTAPTEQHPDGIYLTSTVFRGFNKFGIYNPAIKGGKTGFTDGAGRCLATYAYCGDCEYILITLGGADTEDEKQMSFIDQGNIYSAYFIG